MGHEDLARESTGSDVFPASQPPTSTPNAATSPCAPPTPPPGATADLGRGPTLSPLGQSVMDGARRVRQLAVQRSAGGGLMLDHRRRLPLSSSAFLRARSYFAARCSGVWSSRRSCSRTRLCVLPLTTLETVSRRRRMRRRPESTAALLSPRSGTGSDPIRHATCERYVHSPRGASHPHSHRTG